MKNISDDLLLGPSAPPPTLASASAITSESSGMEALNNFNPTLVDFSVDTLSNLNHSRSQDFLLSGSSHESLDSSTPLKSLKNLKKSDLGMSMSSMASSRSSLSTLTVK